MCFRIRGYRAAPFLFTSYSFIVDNFIQFAPFFSTDAVLFYCRRSFLLALLFSTSCVLSCSSIMGRKCCVRGCKSNYDVSTAKNAHLKIKNDRGKENFRNVKMFGLPIESEERKIWIKSIPNLTEEVVANLKTNPAVCVRHWPANFSVTKSSANGSMRPERPPSIFEGVPMSSLPTPPPPPRTTTKSSFLDRTARPDELQEFLAAELYILTICVQL